MKIDKNKKKTVLIIYASNSGSTFLVARIIHKNLESKFKVITKKASVVKAGEIARASFVLMGSPSWSFGKKEGMPHESFLKMTTEINPKNFKNKPIAIFGCGDSSYTVFCGAVDYLEKFAKSNNGQLITASLRIDGFFFNLEKNSQKAQSWAQKLSKKL